MKETFRYIAVGLIGMLIVVSPFLVNYADMPWGFERPKAMFSLFLMIVTIGVVAAIAFKLPKVWPWRLALLIGWLLVTTFFASDIQIAVWGNPYRFQGLIFYLSLLLFFLSIPKVLSPKVFWLLIFAYLAVGLAQSVIGISQGVKLLMSSLEQLQKGLYVNGTFGQSEFFAGRLLVTIGLSLFALAKFKYPKSLVQSVVKGLIFAVLVASLAALGLSYSRGSLLTLPFLLLLLAIPFISRSVVLTSKSLAYLTYALYAVLALFGGYLAFNWVENDYRSVIWSESTKAILARPINGYGLDNQLNGLAGITDIVVDRGHNFVLDILLCIGVVGGVLLIVYLWPTIRDFWKDLWANQNTSKRIISMLIVSLLLRMVVNTTSSVNVIDLAILAAMWSYLNTLAANTSETMLVDAWRTDGGQGKYR